MGILSKQQDQVAEVVDHTIPAPCENRHSLEPIMPFENEAKAFAASKVVCVARQFEDSQTLASAFRKLDFEWTFTDNLEEAFTVVSEGPEDLTFLCVVIDPQISKSALTRWVHQTRLTKHRVPIILFTDKGPRPYGDQEPTRLGDCCVRFPQNTAELDRALGVAVRSNRSFGSRFSHFQNNSVPRPSHFQNNSVPRPSHFSHHSLEPIMPFENEAKAFAASKVVCVARQFEDSQTLASAFRKLDFEWTFTDNLEEAFTVVSEGPEDLTFLCVVIDPQISKSALTRWVHQTRLTKHRVPIILFTDKGPRPYGDQEPTRLGDCCVRFPQNTAELDRALGVAVRSNRSFGSRFSHFQNNSVPRPSHFSHHSTPHEKRAAEWG